MIWMEKREEIWKKIQSNSAANFKANLHFVKQAKLLPCKYENSVIGNATFKTGKTRSLLLQYSFSEHSIFLINRTY